jgi:hypothetical protein
VANRDATIAQRGEGVPSLADRKASQFRDLLRGCGTKRECILRELHALAGFPGRPLRVALGGCGLAALAAVAAVALGSLLGVGALALVLVEKIVAVPTKNGEIP